MSKNPRFPNLSTLDKEEARTVAARCAAMRHSFVPTSGSGWMPAFGYGIAFRCTNCGSWRFDTRSPVDNSKLCVSYELSPEYKEAISDKQPHARWVAEYVESFDADQINRDPDAPAHRLPGQRNSYPKKKR